jgi:hypothetical protein
MPFAGRSCFSFTYASLRQNAPRTGGVYAISNAREWLLVGSADDLQSALHQHLMETGTALKSHAPTGFSFQECERVARQGLLDSLIKELRPTCNSQPKRRGDRALHQIAI